MPKHQYTIRIIIDLVIAFSIFHGWWLAVILGLCGAWFFPYFIEAINAGVAYDALFGFVPSMGVAAEMGTIVAVVLFSLVTGFKRVVRK